MIRHLWPLLVGFTLWALALIALYALQYLGCHFGWAPMAHRVALLVAYAIAVASLTGTLALQIAIVRKRGSTTMSVNHIGLGATIAALVATAVTFGPMLLVSACI
jgi:hypothetical protein